MLVFPFLNTKHKQIKNSTKFINQNLKKLAKCEEITSNISTGWGIVSPPMQYVIVFVMVALNFNNMKTTVGYFARFENKDKKKFMQKLMNL
jgi:integrase/recombinase XerD